MQRPSGRWPPTLWAATVHREHAIGAATIIAANFRKYPSAAALQLPLPFGRLLVWATKRPTTALLRSIRAARGAAFKLAGRIRYRVATPTPQWYRLVVQRARALATRCKQVQQPLRFA